MSRYASSGSYGHQCRYIQGFGGFYRMSWVVDYYYPGVRLRWPRTFSRDTDEVGAKRFCKRWQIAMPAKELV